MRAAWWWWDIFERVIAFSNGLADEAFDRAQIGAFILIAETDGDAGSARAAGAADAMNVGFWFMWDIEVHHVGDGVDVDAARGDVAGDQQANAAVAE